MTGGVDGRDNWSQNVTVHIKKLNKCTLHHWIKYQIVVFSLWHAITLYICFAVWLRCY